VNFNYFISEAVFSYIVEAVWLVDRDGGACSATTVSMPPRFVAAPPRTG
jgi:hypothetical protein